MENQTARCPVHGVEMTPTNTVVLMVRIGLGAAGFRVRCEGEDVARGEVLPHPDQSEP